MCPERLLHWCLPPYFLHGGVAMVMTLQPPLPPLPLLPLTPLLPLLLPTKIAITAASALIIAKAKTVGLSAHELPVSPLNPATTLFAKSPKKPGGLLDPPEPIWSPNANWSIIATIVAPAFRAA